MQVYNEMAVISTSPDIGQIEVAWFDNRRDAQNKLLTPIKDQYIVFRSHKVPVEAELENWTRGELRDYWMAEVEDIADIPAWVDDELGRFSIEQPLRLRRNTPT